MSTDTLIPKEKRLASKPSKGFVPKKVVRKRTKRSTWCDNFLGGGRVNKTGAIKTGTNSHTWIHRPLRKMRLQGRAKILCDFGEQVEGAIRDKANQSNRWRNV